MKAASLALSALLLCSACGDSDAQPARNPAAPDAAARDASVLDAQRPPATVDAADRDRPDARPVEASTQTDAARAVGVTLPPSNGGLDYQLGGAYTPPAGVSIVSRDRHEAPAAGLYNLCYVNGFQAQAEEADFWLDEQPDLVLRDSAGKPVIDKDWDEMLLDVSSAEKRTRLAAIVGGWIDGCARAGFDAVEVDNLDSYARSGGRLKMDDAVAFSALLAQAAHAQGLALAQKNSSELVPRKPELGTDFAVAEECSRYDECDDYSAGYGEHVLMIEYRKADFDKGCARYPGYSVVLRDLNLVEPGDAAYVFDDC